MKYIYESPDNGKTIYRRIIGTPHSERELIQSPTMKNIEGLVDVSVTEDGIVVIKNDLGKQ